ncbi:MAG: glycoside hydrolase family 16 protein [Vicingaceae bacterium]
MKYLLIMISTLSFFIGLAQNPIQKEGWELTFNDEFNGDKLDREKWRDSYYWGGRYNKDGVNYYGKDQFQFTDSTLLLVAEKNVGNDSLLYKSGLIDSSPSFKQQYGYFEIRSKNPKGTGFWPAFWLVSTESWPPEIDIYEFYTNEPGRIKTNQHWLNGRKKKRMQPKGYKMKVDAADDFHVYAVEWSERKIKWFYDGKRIKTSRRGRKYLDKKMHIIINNEVSDWNDMDLNDIVLPNYFEIDYVRAYKKIAEE